MSKTENKKITVYVVNDDCYESIIYDDLESATEYLKECLDGIDFNYEVGITKKQMTRKEFNNLPEM